MAFFSKKKNKDHQRDQQQHQSNINNAGPSQQITSPGGSSQQPTMYLSSSRAEAGTPQPGFNGGIIAPGSAGPPGNGSNNAMPFEMTSNMQSPGGGGANGMGHQQQQYPQGGYIQQQQQPYHSANGPHGGGPLPQQQSLSSYPGPGPLSNGVHHQLQHQQQQQMGTASGSPQSVTYPNGIGIGNVNGNGNGMGMMPASGSGSSVGAGASASAGSGGGGGPIGPGGLPARNFSNNSNNMSGSVGPSGNLAANVSNSSLNNLSGGPPLQPIPQSGGGNQGGNQVLQQSQQQQSATNQSQNPHSHHGPHSSSSGSHSSSPVSYPWSQRPIRLQPIQLTRPGGSGSNSDPTLSQQPPPQSTEISPSPFPRYGHSVNPIAQSSTGDLYLFGGLVKDEVRNDLFMISCSNPNPIPGQPNDSKALAGAPVHVSLIETRGERPCPRVGHASVSVGNVLIVWGGDTKTKEEDPQDNNLYLLNLGSREWTLVKVSGASPQGRYGHAAAMRGSKFYVFGGQQDVPPGAPDDAAFLNDLWCFDLQNLKAGKPHWQQIQYAADAPTPPNRTGHTMVNYGDKLYVFGGTDGQFHYNDTWCFNPATSTWSELSCIGYIPVPREGHAATLVDDVVYVFGGRSVDGKDLEDLAAFKISNQRWYMFTNMGPAPSGRSGHAMATWHNKVFVLGGESYTSNKVEWPNMLHMLDTGKIKYPSDSRNQQASRKTSSSKMQQPASSSQSQQQQQQQQQSAQPQGPSSQAQNPLSSSVSNKPVQAVTNEDLRRAASPTGSERENSLSGSMNRGILNGIASGSPASNASPAQEPRRPPIDPRRAMSPVSEQPESLARSLSPTMMNNRGLQPSGSFTNTQQVNGTSAYSTPPTRSQATMNGPINTSPPPGVQLNALRANARSPSPQLTRSIDSQTQAQAQSHSQQQPETFQTAMSNAFTPQQPMKTAPHSGETNKWMQAALASAVGKGFDLPEQESEDIASLQPGANQQLVSALLAMRKEIASLRGALSTEARTAEQQIAQANKGRTAALQEAAFYRAKIAALEANSTTDLMKIERTKITELEKRLHEASTANTGLERQLEELESELNHHRDTAQAAAEREQAAGQRAEAAEASYSRSLTDYADLQRRAHVHESSIHDHIGKIATLQSQVEQLTAENAQHVSRLQTAETAVEKHVLTLADLHVSLKSANNHSMEMEGLWQKSRQELVEHQDRVTTLEAQLQRATAQLEASETRIIDLEKALAVAQEESTSLRSLSSGHLTDLLSVSRENSTRNIGKDTDSSAQLQALQTELEQHRSLAAEAHTRATTVQNEVRESRAGHATLEKQIALLRTELAALRTRHASAVEASSRAQALISQRDLDLREKARSIEAAEVKNGLLRSLLAENGLSADENGSPMMGSTSESSASLNRKIAELESRLDQRNQAHVDLQSMHDDARQEAESARQRLRSSEEQIDKLTREVQALKLASTSSAGSEEATARATKAETDLTALQERHQQLEATHLKAVQYVKGTEKMFRRMKDELTKYKERNETLEQELATKASGADKGHSRSMSSELRPELDELRSQLTALRQQSEASTNRNDELQGHITRLKAEYDQQISAQQTETAAKIQECENEIEQLQEALTRAQQEVDDTLAHSKQLEQELQTALKASKSPKSDNVSLNEGEGDGSSTNASSAKLGEDLTQALKRIEWLKRENVTLEDRCREAETKATLLLDHIESSGGVEAVASSVGHSNDHDHDHHTDFQQWKANGGTRRSDEGSDYSASIDSFSQRQPSSTRSPYIS